MRFNIDCKITKVIGQNIYGEPEFGPTRTERCAVVKLALDSAHTTVRADSGASRGHADEFVSLNKILVSATTQAEFGDKLEVMGVVLRITRKQPQNSVRGRLDHYEVSGEAWL